MRIARSNVDTLTNNVALFIPSTVNGNQPATPELIRETIAFVIDRMVNLFGGVTVTDAIGGYKLDNGQVITENIKIVKSSANNIDEDKMIDLALEICEKMSQESVALEIDGQLNLVRLPKALAA